LVYGAKIFIFFLQYICIYLRLLLLLKMMLNWLLKIHIWPEQFLCFFFPVDRTRDGICKILLISLCNAFHFVCFFVYFFSFFSSLFFPDERWPTQPYQPLPSTVITICIGSIHVYILYLFLRFGTKVALYWERKKNNSRKLETPQRFR